MKLKQKINKLPQNPGVYTFKDRSNNYLYIGKAGNIRKRVRTHFQKPSSSGKENILIKKTSSIDCIITSSEVEALILECNLIKEHKPKYNIMLRDDKSYPYIKITLKEEFPAIYLTRDLSAKNRQAGLNDETAKYFGPYTDVKSLRKTLLLLRKIFLFKTCRKTKVDGKPCLNYHIARCVGPCSGKVSREDYMEIIGNVSMFLEGKVQDLISYLHKKMAQASASREYEKAAKLRDRIESIQKMASSQIVSKLGGKNQDFIGYASHKNKGLIALFKIIEGKLLAHENFELIIKANSKSEEAIASFIEQYYSFNLPLPDEIFVPVVIKERKLLEEWFKKTSGKSAKIFIPKRGDKKKLLNMAGDNARYKLMEEITSQSKHVSLLIDLQKKLNLPEVPYRIEGIDISNIRGKSAVGSVVVFENASAQKNEWRKFKIKSVHTIDDYMMMEEVLMRRYRRLIAERNKLPDLVLVDGGKGQVNIAKQVLKELAVENIPVIGIAKGENKIHLSYSSKMIILNPRTESFRFLAHVRDEAHRFAHAYFENLKRKEVKKSLAESLNKK